MSQQSFFVSVAGWVGVTVLVGIVVYLVPGTPIQYANVFPSKAQFDQASSPAHQRLEAIQRDFNLGVQALQRGDGWRAIQLFHRVLQVEPQLVSAHINLGYAFLSVGEFERAQSFFQSALHLDRSEHSTLYGLGLAAEALGHGDVAVAAMSSYLRLAPADDPYRDRAQAVLDKFGSAR